MWEARLANSALLPTASREKSSPKEYTRDVSRKVYVRYDVVVSHADCKDDTETQKSGEPGYLWQRESPGSEWLYVKGMEVDLKIFIKPKRIFNQTAMKIMKSPHLEETLEALLCD